MEYFRWSYEEYLSNPADLLEEIGERWHAQSHWTEVRAEQDRKAADSKRQRSGS